MKLLLIFLLWCGFNAKPHDDSGNITKDSKDVLEDSKSDIYSSKDSKDILAYPQEVPNPLDRIELQWQPTIINPPKVTNVDP